MKNINLSILFFVLMAGVSFGGNIPPTPPSSGGTGDITSVADCTSGACLPNVVFPSSYTDGCIIQVGVSGATKTESCVTSLTGLTIGRVSVDGSVTSTDLTAAQVTGSQISNYGQADVDTYLIAPTAADGMDFVATVGTARAKKWCFEAAANDLIYLIGADGTITAGSNGDAVCFDNAVVGQAFTCWTIKTGSSAWDWSCKAIAIGAGRTFTAVAGSE